MNPLSTARLGALIGIYEAIAIVRWDWLMDDYRPERVAIAFAWAFAIIALNIGFFALIGRVLRRSLIATAVVYGGMVYLSRWMGDDRWDRNSGYAAIAIVIVLIVARLQPLAMGLLAIALATPGLWGRVPVYTMPVSEQLCFLLPGAITVLIAGMVLHIPKRGRSLRIAAALIGLVMLSLGGFRALSGSDAGSGSQEQPNVLFVLVDTLRQDHVQPYGDKVKTPSMRRLAEEGVRFADAITVIPKTTQSVAAFQTGRYPVTNGVRLLRDALGKQNTTLAEVLNANGYTTGAFVHNGWVMRGRGFEQGFQQFWSFFEVERAWGPPRLTGWITALDTFTTKRLRKFDGNTDAKVLTDRVIDWLGEVPQPFYGYVHYFDPHWPYRPPGEDGECTVNNIRSVKGTTRGKMMFQNKLPAAENDRACALYRGEVSYNADQFGRLLTALDELGVADDTVVVFTADHGHSLGEHDYWYHHGEFLYEASTRIPLLIRAPGRAPAGQVVDGQVRSIDVMPTLLGLAGLSDQMPDLNGVDVFKEKPGPAFLETDISYFPANKRRYIKGVLGKPRGVRTDKWKLIYTPRKGQGVWEIYDLENDPEELNNLLQTGTVPESVGAALLYELAKWIPKAEKKKLRGLGNRFDALPKHAKLAPLTKDEGGTDEGGDDLSDTEREMLRALGYVE
jgi:arylsulfatase A-like enzyme